MLTIIIFVLMISISIRIANFDSLDFMGTVEKIFSRIIITIIGSLIGLFIGFLLIFSICFCLPKEYVQREVEIYSLFNSSQISGNFFLGSGSIDNEEYYFCFEKDENGVFRRLKLKVEECGIIESDETPKYVYKSVISKFDNLFCLGELWKKDDKLIVPKNTIIRKYVVN